MTSALRTTATYLDRGLVGDLINNGVKFDVKPREEGSLLMSLLVSWGPMLLLIGVWVYFMRQMQGGGKGGAFSFGKSKARMLDEANNTRSPLPTSPAATRPRKRSRNWSTS
jgi:cell division protease FtsH